MNDSMADHLLHYDLHYDRFLQSAGVLDH